MTLTASRVSEQRVLSEYAPVFSKTFGAPAKLFTITEAKEWAEMTVRALPKGTTFTSMRLLGGVRLRGDKRARGAIIKHLQRLRLISPAGFTTDDQEGRNKGYAIKWRVEQW